MKLIPNSVKLGAMTYILKTKEDLHYVNKEGQKQGLYGNVDYAHAEIQIDPDQSPDMLRASVLHELTHAMLYQAGDTEHSEAVAVALGYALLGLIRDNPQLVGWLQEKELIEDVLLKRQHFLNGS